MIQSIMFDEQDFSVYLTIKRGVSETTARSYTSYVRCYLRFCKNNPSLKLTEDYLYHLKFEKRFNNNSINSMLTGICAWNDCLKDRGNPLDFSSGFKSLKVERKVVDKLTVNEIKRILNTKLYTKTGKIRPTYDERIFFTEVLASTGARFNEIATLTPRYVYEDHIIVTRTKGYAARTIYITPTLSRKLHKKIVGKRPNELIFTTSNGGRMHPGDFLGFLTELFEAAGVKKHAYPHVFRHSFATQLRRDGARLEDIKEILGHKDIATTLHYTNEVDLEKLKKTMFKHSLLREDVQATDVLEDFKRHVRSFGLQLDPRFFIKIRENDHGFTLDTGLI